MSETVVSRSDLEVLHEARVLLSVWNFAQDEQSTALKNDTSRAQIVLAMRKGLDGIFPKNDMRQARFLSTKLDSLDKRSPKECMLSDDESFWRATKLIDRTVNG
jgi:hypothetical protein